MVAFTFIGDGTKGGFSFDGGGGGVKAAGAALERPRVVFVAVGAGALFFSPFDVDFPSALVLISAGDLSSVRLKMSSRSSSEPTLLKKMC
jgi:hypothetical protein